MITESEEPVLLPKTDGSSESADHDVDDVSNQPESELATPSQPAEVVKLKAQVAKLTKALKDQKLEDITAQYRQRVALVEFYEEKFREADGIIEQKLAEALDAQDEATISRIEAYRQEWEREQAARTPAPDAPECDQWVIMEMLAMERERCKALESELCEMRDKLNAAIKEGKAERRRSRKFTSNRNPESDGCSDFEEKEDIEEYKEQLQEAGKVLMEREEKIEAVNAENANLKNDLSAMAAEVEKLKAEKEALESALQVAVKRTPCNRDGAKSPVIYSSPIFANSIGKAKSARGKKKSPVMGVAQLRTGSARSKGLGTADSKLATKPHFRDVLLTSPWTPNLNRSFAASSGYGDNTVFVESDVPGATPEMRYIDDAEDGVERENMAGPSAPLTRSQTGKMAANPKIKVNDESIKSEQDMTAKASAMSPQMLDGLLRAPPRERPTPKARHGFLKMINDTRTLRLRLGISPLDVRHNHKTGSFHEADSFTVTKSARGAATTGKRAKVVSSKVNTAKKRKSLLAVKKRLRVD